MGSYVRHALGTALALSLLVGCGSSKPPPSSNNAKACSVANQTGCKTGQVCEQIVGGTSGCFAPVTVQGQVFDTTTNKGIEGADVVARDVNGAAVSSVAVTDKSGNYTLDVPVPRTDKKGTLSANTKYTLRADAAGYVTFPKPPRTALPVDMAAASGNPPVVKSTATNIGLIPLPNATGLGAVSGHVKSDHPGGTLVVAGGSTGIADTAGAYTVFNVQPGTSVAVQGYASGVNLKPATADVKAGATTKNVDLDALGKATATVSGTVQIVNAPGGSATSVILVVDATFDPNVARGEAPPGLKAEGVTGAWSIPNVPDGTYDVLAAFENDGLVRDPDTSIGGTKIIKITVSGSNQAISQGFKVTGALTVSQPPDPSPNVATMSGTPQFAWASDPSAGSYSADIYDALGNKTWGQTGIAGPKGNGDVTLTYGGPALKPGMFYQLRAESLSKAGVPISATEDLKGVFVYK